jgi:hypothetical protein
MGLVQKITREKTNREMWLTLECSDLSGKVVHGSFRQGSCTKETGYQNLSKVDTGTKEVGRLKQTLAVVVAELEGGKGLG